MDIGHNLESPARGQDDVTESSNFTVFVFTTFLTSGDRETMSSNNIEKFLTPYCSILGSLVNVVLKKEEKQTLIP